MNSVPKGQKVVIGADFNGHVGEGNSRDEEVMGRYGVKERNEEGQRIVDFAKRMDMAVVNTYFKKREEHRVRYKSGGRCTQVDYILCRRVDLKEIEDCKVVAGESVFKQHRMGVCRMTLEIKKRKRVRAEPRIKWWTLKRKTARFSLGRSLIDRRGYIQPDTPQSVAPSNGITMYGATQFQSNMCDQDQCIQSTKFVLQAAATPLLQTDSNYSSDEPPLPGKTTLSVPCGTLPLGQPTPPTSTPNLTSEAMLADMLQRREEQDGHHFLTPEEAPSPPGMLSIGSTLTHSHTMHIFNPASQDSLHEDSVRGLVKLSSV
ncbi:ZDH14 palmitoyltransferase, partial [Polypterus senegalus]